MIPFWYHVAGFTAALVLVVVFTRWLRARGADWGLLDRPLGPRRHHGTATPLVGGMAMVPAVLLPLLLLATTAPVAAILQVPGSEVFASLLLGALAMHLFGVWDDVREFSPQLKLCGQVAIAAAVFAGGLRLASLPLPGVGIIELSLGPSLLITVLWLVAITNAFNLVDGADGVAAGAGLLATLAMLGVSLVVGHALAALILAVTAGALLGFLYFNFPPASVFLGDGGSLFLGFLLAGLGIAGSGSGASAVAIGAPLVAFGLPVLDTGLVVLRRTIRGVPIVRADRRHIHHRLLELGHSPREVVAILYAVGGLFGVASLAVLSGNGPLIGSVFLLLGGALGMGLQKLRFPELREIGHAIGRARERIAGPGGRAPPPVRLSNRLLLSIDVGAMPSAVGSTFSGGPTSEADEDGRGRGSEDRLVTGAAVPIGGEPTHEA